MGFGITVTESTFIARPPDVVWDFTQDYSRRREWDSAILEAVVVSRDPVPRVRIAAAGGLKAIFQYKEFLRPVRTSLALEDVQSAVVSGGGGSWSYESVVGGTRWTQTNTIVLKPGWWRRALAPLMRITMRAATRKAMANAKRALEASATKHPLR